MVDGQRRHSVNGQQGLFENKDVPINVSINSKYFCSDNFTFKNAIWKASLAILIFHLHEVVNKCQCHQISALPCMKFTSPKNNLWCDVKALTSFTEEFCGFQIHAKLYSSRFMNDFDKNMGENPDLQPY